MATRSLAAVRLLASPGRLALVALGAAIVAAMVIRVAQTIVEGAFPPHLWAQQFANGLALGFVYALIALGYTLVYGILFMINFAHGEVLMLGAFAGFFGLDASERAGLIAASPLGIVALAFLAGMTVSTLAGILLERIAYRPLRNAPRLVPLISAIGASIFLQNAALLAFGPRTKVYPTPQIAGLAGGQAIGEVFVPNTSILILIISVVMMVGLGWVVNRTRFGRAMR